ncbi:MAG: alpha/beta hydrolase [Pseudomonadales bacterium]|nr:alpha/beta hydrolase [Pseudomonadales bacterium]
MANKEIENIVNMMLSSLDSDAPMPSVEEMRVFYEAMGGAFPVGDDITINTIELGGVPTEEICPNDADPSKVILYFHGGGYALGSFVTHRSLVSDLARASGRNGYLIDYRLAPENVFPAPIEDAVSAYKGLLETKNISASDIVFGGDSAGGGMVMATLLKLKELNLPLPAAALCISPWVDLQMTGDTHQSKADVDPMVHKEDLAVWVEMYLKSTPADTPLASPIHGDLSGLPPLLIQVGSAETLLDDSRMLAANAKAAGVTVDLQEWEDMIHVWHHFAPMVEDGRKAISDIGTFYKKF